MRERVPGWPRGVAILAAIAAALAAQSLVAEQPYRASAWLLYAVAGLVVAVAATRFAKSDAAGLPRPMARSWLPPRSALALTAIALVVAATATSAAGISPVASVAAWLLGLALATLAVRGWRTTQASGARRSTDHAWVVLAVILCLAAAARFTWIDTLPGRYFDDESRLGHYLLRLRSQGAPSYFNLGWNAWPIPGMALQGVLGFLTEMTTTSLRLASALFGTLAVATTYLAARNLFSARVALLAALLLAANRTAIDISRLGTCHAQVLALTPLAFALWWDGINTGKASRYFGAGIAAGLCMYTYNAGQLVAVVLLAWVIVSGVSRRLRSSCGRGAVVAAAGFVLTLMPLAFQVTDGFRFQEQWQNWLAVGRGRQLVGVVADELRQDRPAEALRLVRSQVSSAWLGFFALPSKAYELGYRGGGMSDDATSALFFLGLALCIGGRFGARGGFVALWWAVMTLLAGVLTRDPPVFQRLVGVLPAVAILAALPLEALLGWAETSRRRAAVGYVVLAGLMAVTLWQTWRTYFVEFAGQALDFTSALARTLETLEPGRPVALVGPEYTWHASGWQQHQFSFKHDLIRLNFAGRRLFEIGETAHLLPLRFPPDPPPAIVFGPTQMRRVEEVVALYPGAQIRRFGHGDHTYAVADLSRADVQAHSGLRLVRLSGGGPVDLGVEDPLSPTTAVACPGREPCELEWSGRIYWPSSRPTTFGLVGDRLEEVRVGGTRLQIGSGGNSVAQRLELPRGWHPIVVRQRAAQGSSRLMSCRSGGVGMPLGRSNFSPDEEPHGLLARYERHGRVVDRAIDPQLNHVVDERLFAGRDDLHVRLPFRVRWRGRLRIEQPGVYRFKLAAGGNARVELDGAALLSIGNAVGVVVDVGAERRLAAGSYSIDASWDTGPTDPSSPRAVFQLFWTPPGGREQLIPAASFVPAPSPPVVSAVGPDWCTDDCNRDGAWTVDEVVRVAMMGLGSRPLSACPTADVSADGQITIDELVSAVGNALNGCR